MQAFNWFPELDESFFDASSQPILSSISANSLHEYQPNSFENNYHELQTRAPLHNFFDENAQPFPCFREQQSQNNWQSGSQMTGEYWRSGSHSTGEYCQSRSQNTGEYWQSRSQTSSEYWQTPNWTEQNLEGPINTLSSEFSNDDQASWQNCALLEDSQSSLTSRFGHLLPTGCQEESASGFPNGPNVLNAQCNIITHRIDMVSILSFDKSFLEKNLNGGRNLDQPKKRNRSKDPKVLTRKKPRMESNWIDNKAKKARAMGVEGVGRNGKIIQKREMGPGCKIDCRFKCHTRITTEERKNAFALFWGQGDRAKQWRIINNWTNPNRKDKNDKSNGNDKTKSVSHYFTLPGKDEGSFVPVCGTMFLKTLDISNQMIRTATLKKKDENELFKNPSCRIGKHKNRPHKICNENLEEVRKHIKSFPLLDSHYCRATSTKQYLDENLSIAKMYELYKEEMDRRGLSCVHEQIYRRIFTTEFNLDFYVPKKDKCEKCERFSKLPAAEQIEKQKEQALHLENKNIVKDLIESDRPTPLQDPFLCVANFDLQKTLNVPKADIGPLYYMTKLVIWNFTIFEMGHKIGHCNVWNETVGKKGANEIASFLWDFIRQKSQAGVRRFIFYSDNCSGQNRNKMVFSMYFKAALDFNVSIVHRFMEVGHTMCDGDSMHARIEKYTRRRSIYTEKQWCDLMRECKKKNHYQVNQRVQSDIFDFQDLSTNFNWTSSKISTIREIMLKPNDTNVYIKYDFKHDSCKKSVLKKDKDLTTISEYQLKRAYYEKFDLPEKKKEDLYTILKKRIIPTDDEDFYKKMLS